MHGLRCNRPGVGDGRDTDPAGMEEVDLPTARKSLGRQQKDAACHDLAGGVILDTEGGTRTHTGVTPPDFESGKATTQPLTCLNLEDGVRAVCTPACTRLHTEPLPDDLQAIVRSWPNLPEHIRRTILTLVASSGAHTGVIDPVPP